MATLGRVRRLTRARDEPQEKCACQVMLESGDLYPTGWFTEVYKGRLQPNGKCQMCRARQEACQEWLQGAEDAQKAGPEAI